uniref:Si:dkey-27i16.2 n=1 Tax=Lepisosteus oculatus TaxID=7918 RepID=W5NC82_LEPOC
LSAPSPAALDSELGDLLQEFHDVMEELRTPEHSRPEQYQEYLRQPKRSSAVCDSGIEDSDCSRELTPNSSLNTSEEDLNTAGTSAVPKAKLGDLTELENFIENLDRELAGM